MPTDLGPPYDRVQLSPAERRVIASLEYHLAEEERAAARPSARARRAVTGLGRRLLRSAALLLPLGVFVTVATFSVSAIAGTVSLLVTTILLVLAVRTWLRVRRCRSGRDERRREPG
jgi:small-conductance mechanosensitive channel